MRVGLWVFTAILTLQAIAWAQDGAVRIFVRETFIEITPAQQNEAIDEIESRPTRGGAYPGRFPEVSTTALSMGDLQGFSCPTLWVMRNEVYARHGRPFVTRTVKRYFQTQSWYRPDPRYRLPQDDSLRLTKLEKANTALILRYEKNIGCPL